MSVGTRGRRQQPRYEPCTPLLDQMKRLNRRVYRLAEYFDRRAAAR